jgi:hypothetical protein
LTPKGPPRISAVASGDVLQGAAADCNSAGETHAWFDSRVAHHLSTTADPDDIGDTLAPCLLSRLDFLCVIARCRDTLP